MTDARPPAEPREPLLDFLMRLMHEQGDVAAFDFAGAPAFLVSGPSAIEHVLVEQARAYEREPTHWQLAAHLLTARGKQIFRSQERALASNAPVRSLAEDLADALSDGFEEALRDGRDDLDVTPLAHLAGVRVMSRQVFGVELAHGDCAQFLSAARQLDDVRIAERRAMMLSNQSSDDVPARTDAVAALIAAADQLLERHPSGMFAPDSVTLDVKRGVVELLIFSYESLANALAFALFVLASEPAWQAPFRRVPSGSAPASVQVRMFTRELLRLYPPAWLTGRVALTDDVLDGRAIPAGSLVSLSPFTLHRNGRHWLNPDVFDPERFSNGVERSPFMFCPFGAGPRMCVAAGESIRTIEQILVRLTERYHLSDGPGTLLEPVVLSSLRPPRVARLRLARISGYHAK